MSGPYDATYPATEDTNTGQTPVFSGADYLAQQDTPVFPAIDTSGQQTRTAAPGQDNSGSVYGPITGTEQAPNTVRPGADGNMSQLPPSGQNRETPPGQGQQWYPPNYNGANPYDNTGNQGNRIAPPGTSTDGRPSGQAPQFTDNGPPAQNIPGLGANNPGEGVLNTTQRDQKHNTYDRTTIVDRPSVIGTALFGGFGAYMGAGPVHRFANHFAAGVTGEDLGAKFFGDGTFLRRNIPQLGPSLDKIVPKVDALGQTNAAKTTAEWIGNNIKPLSAEAAVTVPAGAATTATTAEAVSGFSSFTKTAGNILSKPGTQDFLKGAGLAGGVILAERILPFGSDDYHLTSLGIPLALAMPGDFKSKAMVAGGSLLIGRAANAMLSASDHPHLAEIMKPNILDTTMVTGSLFLPISNPQVKMATIGGSWMMGRMAGMNGWESGLTAAGLGYGAYRLTKNPIVGVGVGAGSWLVSRAVNSLHD